MPTCRAADIIEPPPHAASHIYFQMPPPPRRFSLPLMLIIGFRHYISTFQMPAAHYAITPAEYMLIYAEFTPCHM